MKRIIALSVGMLLAAPASAIDLPQPVPIKSIDWLPDTTVRMGHEINAAYRVTTLTHQISEIWIHTDCQTQEKTLLFINTQPGKGLRVYSTSSADRYTAGTPFEPDADSLFMTKPELDLCQQNIPESKWAGTGPGVQPGERRFVDINNSRRQGEMLSVRLATDYDKIHRDEKYAAPYSVKIEDVVLNCNTAQGMTLRTFSLDNHGMVSDSAAAKNAAFVALPPDMTGIAKKLCATADLKHYAGSGTLTWRDKNVDDTASIWPDFEHNTPAALQQFVLPAEVTGVIEKTFSDPQQKPTFGSLRYRQSGPEADAFGLMARVDPQPDGTTLTIVQMNLANIVFFSQYQRLFNMVDVKKWEIMSAAPRVSKTLDNGISLPLRPGKVYAAHSRMVSRDKPEKDQILSNSCVAGEKWLNAADLNPHFPGRYLPFFCQQDLGDGREVSSDYAYLAALNVFIRIGYHQDGKAIRFTFSDVQIIR